MVKDRDRLMARPITRSQPKSKAGIYVPGLSNALRQRFERRAESPFESCQQEAEAALEAIADGRPIMVSGDTLAPFIRTVAPNAGVIIDVDYEVIGDSVMAVCRSDGILDAL